MHVYYVQMNMVLMCMPVCLRVGFWVRVERQVEDKHVRES